MRAILTYHSIDRSGSVISVDESTFAEHVRFLASGAVRVVPLAELVDDDGPGDAVALTFDDGFANFATAAWPRLREHGLPATVFVVAGHAGGENRWASRGDADVPHLPLLDWAQIGALADDGVEIGSHSCSHPRLDRIGHDRLEAEIHGSAVEIGRRIGRRPTTFCYPFGNLDERVAGIAAQVYERACTTRLAYLPAEPDRARLPRLDCYYVRRPGDLERWGTVRFRTRIAVRARLRDIRRFAEVATSARRVDAP